MLQGNKDKHKVLQIIFADYFGKFILKLKHALKAITYFDSIKFCYKYKLDAVSYRIIYQVVNNLKDRC